MKINVDDTEIEIIYERHPANRGVYFTHVDGNTFRMTGRFKENPKMIEDIVLRNKKRMLKIIEKSLNNTQAPNTLHYLGNLYTLKEVESTRNLVYIKDDFIICEHKPNISVERLIKAFYVDAVSKYTEMVFDEIFNKFIDLKIQRPRLVYKYTKTFYGKCFTRENKIEISGMCMKMAPKYIDCVITHELCHFKYQNHQASFYKYFEEKMPNCKKIQHEFRSLKYKDIY